MGVVESHEPTDCVVTGNHTRTIAVGHGARTSSHKCPNIVSCTRHLDIHKPQIIDLGPLPDGAEQAQMLRT